MSVPFQKNVFDFIDFIIKTSKNLRSLTPVLLKLLIIVQMCKKHEEEFLSPLFWHPICHNLSRIDYSIPPQRCEVPISIVAVNRIEVIDHIVWFYNELNIYGGAGDFSDLSSHALIFLT